MSTAALPFPAIGRVEITESVIRIYLSLNLLKIPFEKTFLYLILANKDHQKRLILKGSLPHEPSSFSFFNLEDNEKILSAEFNGNRYGGDVTLQMKDLPSFEEFFIQIEQPALFFEETPWHPLKPIYTLSSKVIALIPCYNAAPYCEKVVKETMNYVDHVILVNDGSTDTTKSILEKLAHENPSQISFLNLEKNQGKGTALLKGFKYALSHVNFDILITVDADGQHRPSDIPYLAKAVEEGEDLVIGSRLFKLMPFRSRIGNHLIALLLRLFYKNAPLDTQSGLRAFNKSLIQDIANNVGEGRYEVEFKCLLLALSRHRKIKPLMISTLYIDKNVSSHFSVTRDSVKILGVLFKHLFKRKI